jgi:DNA-binding response OmpR family regulator
MPALTILIADDDPLLRTLVEHKLSLAGHRVIAAEDGAQALAEIGRLKPDLVVLDAMMPVLDGFEVLRRLKGDPATAGLPVIMLTALKREADIVGALELGAADYLVKPFIPDELVMRIRRFLPATGGRDAGNGDNGNGGAPSARGHG